MMMPSSGGSWLYPLLMVVVMIAFVAVIAGVARAALWRPTEQQNALGGGNDPARAGDEPPLAVLRRRFVRGDIELEELERRVELLIRQESTPQHELSTRLE
jgi:uncharacterized membrane protein